MATKIRPLHDRVIVKRIEEEEKSNFTYLTFALYTSECSQQQGGDLLL